jgi:hypothetical protein
MKKLARLNSSFCLHRFKGIRGEIYHHAPLRTESLQVGLQFAIANQSVGGNQLVGLGKPILPDTSIYGHVVKPE